VDAVPFVSKHATLRDGELESWLQSNKLSYTDPGGQWIRVRECPFCHATNGKLDNMFKLNLSKANGSYNCFRCHAKGSYAHFKHRLHVLRQRGVDVGPEQAHSVQASNSTAAVPVPHAGDAARGTQRLSSSASDGVARSYLVNTRGLRMDVIEKYGVGLVNFNFKDKGSDDWVRHECFAFPMYGAANQLVRQKIRGVQDKRHMRLYPTGGGWGLFGLQTVPADATEIVITEGEFDAMAVYQAAGLPAVSLPSGASSLPPAVLPLLERFDKVYLWMDNDAAGRANQEIFARKLGVARTVLVGPSSTDPVIEGTAEHAKDANEALLKRMDVAAMLRQARHVPHEQILALDALRDDVLLYLRDPYARAGVQFKSLPGLNSIIKGHRRGEFSVLTGPTGVGKTTLLMQLSLDLAAQGIRTLWGSFEISNSRLVSQMFLQFIGGREGADALRSHDGSGEEEEEEDHEAFNEAWAEFSREIPVT
jgi:twinkle protein